MIIMEIIELSIVDREIDLLRYLIGVRSATVADTCGAARGRADALVTAVVISFDESAQSRGQTHSVVISAARHCGDSAPGVTVGRGEGAGGQEWGIECRGVLDSRHAGGGRVGGGGGTLLRAVVLSVDSSERREASVYGRGSESLHTGRGGAQEVKEGREFVHPRTVGVEFVSFEGRRRHTRPLVEFLVRVATSIG